MSRSPTNQQVMSKTILLVEDDESLRYLLTIVLSGHDGVGEIIEAGDGTEALEICRETAPDIVVIDGKMPKMAGNETGIAIREMHPDTHIIKFSGLDGAAVWANEVISKGAGVEALESAVRALL